MPVSVPYTAWFHSALACFEEGDLLAISAQCDPRTEHPTRIESSGFLRSSVLGYSQFKLGVQFKVQSSETGGVRAQGSKSSKGPGESQRSRT